MNDEEKRLRDAFLALHVPEGLNKKTLAYIESCRMASTCDEATVETNAEVQSAKSVAMQAASSKLSREKPSVKVRRGGKFRVVAALVACFCLAFAGMGGYAYATPSAFVSVEAPVGMALKVNCFDIVVGIESFDGADVKGIAVPVDVVGKTYTEAINAIAQANQTLSTAEGSSERAAIDISITSDNEQQIQNLQQESESCMNAHGMHGHCQSATHEERQAALDEGMGVARYLVAQELLALDPSLTLDDCRTMSMAELRERIANLGGDASAAGQRGGCAMGGNESECSNEDETETASGNHGHGNGYGYGKGNGARGHGMHGARAASNDA